LKQYSGTLLCIAAALLYGMTLPMSRLLFDGASNPLTLGLARYAALAGLLALWLLARGRGPALTLRQALAATTVGGLFALISVGQLLAIERISVSLATMVFYTYPAMTLTVVALRAWQLPGVRPLSVVVLASAGLVFALDVQVGSLDPIGVGFALLAAVSVCASFVLIESALAHADTVRSASISALSATALSAIALVVFSEVKLPEFGPDALLMGLVMLIFSAAVLSMYMGIASVGSVRAALVLFLEPVTSILLAIAVLGERLTTGQSLGAVAVVLAVLVAGLPPLRTDGHSSGGRT
jgi:drug/metabolite transporter (DMT)-like permease